MPLPRTRRAVTLVEVMVSVAILGIALTPVVGMMHKSFGDIRLEKDEANAAAVSGQILNQILFEAPFAAVNGGNYTSPGTVPPEQIIPTGTKFVDGTEINWDITAQPVAGLKFLYYRYKYHDPAPHTASAEPAPPNLTDTNLFYLDLPGPPGSGTTTFNRDVSTIDAKYTGTPVLLDVRLRVRWRPPGATAWTKEEALFVRRAKLD